MAMFILYIFACLGAGATFEAVTGPLSPKKRFIFGIIISMLISVLYKDQWPWRN
jgi:Na+-translocating ferredoxin:NAD+ oxidoreductase RnfD subunit